ncbi:MAG: DUF3592 domain-containing protein [Pseudomonadota bacterium]
MENVIGPSIALFMGGIFAAIGFAFRYHNQKLRKNMIRVPVEVIDLVSSRDSDGDTTYAPVYEITDGPHKGRTHKSGFSSKPAIHNKGDRVEGIFNPDSGQISSIKASNLANLIASGAIAVGVMIIGFALLGAIGLGPLD